MAGGSAPHTIRKVPAVPLGQIVRAGDSARTVMESSAGGEEMNVLFSCSPGCGSVFSFMFFDEVVTSRNKHMVPVPPKT
jgi:hypothetical protein